ncbi:hypothetical protein SAMN02745866_03801 [Alteromonadaceae bacterium Bs31]|nr:hypothetical protein SAMN02745866_03801 [Alteromonadaceae bacterium Bs31]
MMRTLAEFTMRGRMYAMLMVLVGSVIPPLALFTPAAISLVTLRKGWQEGILLSVAAVVLMAALFSVNNVGAFVLYVSTGTVFVAFSVAAILRYTVSWQATLAALVACSMLVSIVASLAVENPLESLLSSYQVVLDQQPAEVKAEMEAALQGINAKTLAGAIAFSTCVFTLLGLLLGRLWQAVLYNPGGLREELHMLRLSMPLAMACMLGYFYCQWAGEHYLYWQMLFLMPPVVAALGFVHWFVAAKSLGRAPLVVLYLALPLIGVFLALIGLSDVWIDYRKRFNLQPKG